jgi:hypothetical protein
MIFFVSTSPSVREELDLHPVGFLERLPEALALGHIARSGEHALQRPIPVEEGGHVVRHLCFLAIAGYRV